MTKAALESVDLMRSDGTPVPGLVSVREQAAEPSCPTIDEQTAVMDAQSFEHIDFVFFRRFSDGRSSQVAAYVINNWDERLAEDDLAKLHLQLWLHGRAPLLYVAWPSRIDILSCARGPDFWRKNRCEYNPEKRLEIDALSVSANIAEELRRFSAFRLADGTFWEDPVNSRLAKYEKAAHQSMIQAVVEADNYLDGANNSILRRLLLLMVLIKYLEDRGVFPNHGWFGRWHRGAKSFFEVLRGGEPAEVLRLLEFLENKFNGDVFRLPSAGQQGLTNESLKRFADFVEGKTLKRQRYLWEQFSFRHLPVEIISHLYQRFVEGGHGKVYTPPFLASLLLDQAMPYGGLSGGERILDPACGSGVFLVGAFRRLVNVWRSKNRWKKPDVATLKEILRQSIFGIELDPFAVDLTAFSLSLAICDALTPEVIWRDLKFDPLRGHNLKEANFFGEVLECEEERGILDSGFDIVVGNPPFTSSLTNAGVELDRARKRQDNGRGKLPDNNAAYLFLEETLKILRPDGLVCLIQPSGFLYNRKTEEFRKSIFCTRQVETILDFTSIRSLYQADPKTIAVFARAGAPAEDHRIAHWTFRRTASVHERICFELDHYDRHRVRQELATNDPRVWRANLLGGGRLHELSRRVRQMRTLADYVQERGWDYGEGFIAAKKGRREVAPFLTGKPFLPTEAMTDSGIDESKIGTVTETHFRSAYTEERYSPPLFLIKPLDTLPVAFWDKGPLAYRDKIVGVHAPSRESAKLRRLHDSICGNRALYRFCFVVNGTQVLVGKATAALKQDVDELPYPEDFRDLSLAFWEEALRDDVLEYMTEYIRLGQDSKLLKVKAETAHIRSYSSLFTRMLGSIYGNLRASDPVFLDGLTCQPFYFGERPDHSWLSAGTEDDLRRIIYDEEQYSHLRTVRVLRFYSENVLLIVKPDRLRYWIRSTAIRDADETLFDLRRQGY